MERMSPRSPEFHTTYVSDKGSGRRVVLESQSRYRVQSAAIDDSRSYRHHRDSHPGSSAKRLRYSGADEAVDQASSHRSSRELDSLLIEASVSSRGARSHGSIREPRRHHLPSPPQMNLNIIAVVKLRSSQVLLEHEEVVTSKALALGVITLHYLSSSNSSLRVLTMTKTSFRAGE